ncbi:zinc ribbon domain-containing protein [Myroides sp. N17-2]|uniref:zinc ribbon domain-containing protein n=1 Tax=Myroides sp. N17-2 TaxID=2030799 RepID=UPI000EFD04F4|nr:C4-type zinc ribbon domain-containing protein [Myroides sp. N17-2]
MTKKKELTVEEKLRALYDLQLIDSRIDEIRNMRGELPLEVEDLQDEVAGLNKRLEKSNIDLGNIETSIKDKKAAIEEFKAAIVKYTEQQNEVKNNREFNSLEKEIEFQKLEIELAEKHIKEMKVSIEFKKTSIVETETKLNARREHLGHKEAELNSIMSETEREEKVLLEKSEEYKQDIEDRLLVAYTRIRNGVRNGLAVVSIERGASGGSYFTIPPQTQVEIAARKKIITDEHSGRILVDSALAEEEREKIDAIIAKL